MRCRGGMQRQWGGGGGDSSGGGGRAVERAQRSRHEGGQVVPARAALAWQRRHCPLPLLMVQLVVLLACQP